MTNSCPGCRTLSTGQGALRTTFSATLPSSRCLTGPRPVGAHHDHVDLEEGVADSYRPDGLDAVQRDVGEMPLCVGLPRLGRIGDD